MHQRKPILLPENSWAAGSVVTAILKWREEPGLAGRAQGSSHLDMLTCNDHLTLRKFGFYAILEAALCFNEVGIICEHLSSLKLWLQKPLVFSCQVSVTPDGYRPKRKAKVNI